VSVPSGRRTPGPADQLEKKAASIPPTPRHFHPPLRAPGRLLLCSVLRPALRDGRALASSSPSPCLPTLPPSPLSDLHCDPALAPPTGDEDDGSGSDEISRSFSRFEPHSPPSPLDLSPCPPDRLDLRDVAVARVPVSSGVLFPPLASLR
jgi:hypothetical protein